MLLFGDTFWSSPYFLSCFVALREKGLTFDTKTIALHQDEYKSPEFKKISVVERIPVLKTADFSLSESSAIIEWLDETYTSTPALLPRTGIQRAQARMIMAWLRSDIVDLRNERPTSTMFYDLAVKPLSADAADDARRLVGLADSLLKPGQKFLFDVWTITDTELAFALNRLVHNGDPVPEHLCTYVQAQLGKSSVVEFMQRERLPYTEYA